MDYDYYILHVVCVCVCRRNELQSKELVAEMVYYFLLPEVEKQTTRERGSVDLCTTSKYCHGSSYIIINCDCLK